MNIERLVLDASHAGQTISAVLKQWKAVPWSTAKDWCARGKVTLNAITTGGPEAAYTKGGYNRFTIRELMAPWDQTAHLCGMRFIAPFAVHAALKVVRDEDLDDCRATYRKLIQALRDDRVDLERAAAAENLAGELSTILSPREVA